MRVWDFVLGSFSIGVLVLGVYALAKHLRLPGRFKSLDEITVIIGVSNWARKQIGADDPRRKDIIRAHNYLWVMNGNMVPAFLARISAQDLKVLAPFIEKVIEGKGPPWNMPAEYEDNRPALLSAFKARMKAESLWPEQRR
jgi:hypothetical protein